MYGLYVPLVSAKAQKVEVPHFPWWSMDKVENQEDLHDVLTSPSRPAIVFLSRYSSGTGRRREVTKDYYYFQQAAVKERLEDYRWYWVYRHSTAGKLIAEKYAIDKDSALLMFEKDGSLLLLDTMVSTDRIAQSMVRMGPMGQMHEAVQKDLPKLKELLIADNVPTVIQYLLYSQKKKNYIGIQTKKILDAVAGAVAKRGDQLIDKALELEKGGHNSQAVEILGRVTRDFKPLKAARRAEKESERLTGKKTTS